MNFPRYAILQAVLSLAAIFAHAEDIAQTNAQSAQRTNAEASAQEWWKASVEKAAKGHLIAEVVVWRENQQMLEYRYDHFPGIERVVMPDGAAFVRTGGKAWVESADWGKTKKPAASKYATAKRDALLDMVVRQARGPLEPVVPDPVEGRMILRYDINRGGTSFQQEREKPVAAGGEYPWFSFMMDSATLQRSIEGKGPADYFLQNVMLKRDWQGSPAQVMVYYYYRTEEGALPAHGIAEDRAAAELRAAAAKPVKVDAVIGLQKRAHLAGVIAGRDFDFTISNEDRTWRQIAVGGKSWMSEDGGRTWAEEKGPDRTYYDLARYAVDAAANETAHWPLETDEKKDKGLGRTRKILLCPEAMEFSVLGTYKMDTGANGTTLRFFDGEAFVENERRVFVHAAYAAMPETTRIAPPPGGPAILPEERPEEILVRLSEEMKGETWHVDKSIRSMDETGTLLDARPQKDVAGTISGNNYDLTVASGVRTIVIDGKAWKSDDGGKSWAETRNPGSAIWLNFFTPGDFVLRRQDVPLYKIMGTEKHGDETWLRIRPFSGLGIGWGINIPGGMGSLCGEQYWLLLDKVGKAVSVRRIVWALGEAFGSTTHYSEMCMVEDFTEAKPGEKIETPAMEKMEAPKVK